MMSDTNGLHYADDAPNQPATPDPMDGYVQQGVPQHVHVFDARTGECECGESVSPEILGFLNANARASMEGGWGNTDVAAQAQTRMIADARAEGVRAGSVPNVVIENPRSRKIVNTVLAVIGITLGVATAVDVNSPQLDFAFITEPAWAAYGILNGAFGLAVINSNIPKAA